MDIEGYIKLYRSVWHNSVWQEKPFSLGQAWIDLLLAANHEDKKILFDGNLIDVKRGSTVTSIRKLCDRWGWSNTKVVKFLTLLKNENMIAFFSDKKKTAITIVNYSLYQDANDTETSQKRHRNDTETSLKHTNKNEKNEKNEKNISSSLYMTMAEKLQALIKENNPGAKTPTDLLKWAEEFEKMERIDKRSPEQIYTVMEFSQKDAFWKANILSAKKLREKYDTLLLQKDRPKSPQQSKTPNKGNFTQRQYSDEYFEGMYKEV